MGEKEKEPITLLAIITGTTTIKKENLKGAGMNRTGAALFGSQNLLCVEKNGLHFAIQTQSGFFSFSVFNFHLNRIRRIIILIEKKSQV